MSFATEIQELVAELASEFGETATFYTYSSRTYNPATGDVTESGVTTTDITVTPPYDALEKYNNFVESQKGDRIVIMPTEGVSITPDLAQKVELDSVLYQIVQFETLSVQGMAVGYILLLRRM